MYTALGSMVALAIDKSSNLYLADAAYNMIRMINPGGQIIALAGSQRPVLPATAPMGLRLC